MAYMICVSNGYVIGVGKNLSETAGITETEYNTISALIRNKPADPAGYAYKLHADTLEWELVELPPEPEDEPTIEDKAEAFDILLGGAT